MWVSGELLVLSVVIALLLAIIAVFILGQFLNLYIQAALSNAHVGILELLGMRLRKADVRMVVYSRIRLVKAGLEVSIAQLETHDLSGGRLANVVSAMIAAKRAGVRLSWEAATTADLAGHDPVAGFAALRTGAPGAPVDRAAAAGLLGAIKSRGESAIGLRAPDPEPDGDEHPLIGAVGEVVQTLGPEGVVRIGGSTFRARASSDPLPTGTLVRVRSARDGLLEVDWAT